MIYYTINGVDISEFVESRSLSIEKILTMHASTASFVIVSPTTIPLEGHDVQIYIDDSTQTLFAGLIHRIQQSLMAPGVWRYEIVCTDYIRLFDRSLVAEVYADGTIASAIINDIISKYTTGFTNTGVTWTTPIIGAVRYDYRTPSDCIRELVETYGNAVWYIDKSKVVWAYLKKSIAASVEINDTTLGNTFYRFSIASDYSQVRNRVYVRGGSEYSSSISYSILVQGQERVWPIGYTPHEITNFELDGVPQTLGEENVDADDGSFAFFYNESEKLFKCAAATSTPTAGQIISWDMKFDIPILTMANDVPSQTLLQTREGGSGIYEYLVVDTNLSSRQMCQTRARRELSVHASPKTIGSATTQTYGLDVGQTITVNVTGCQYNGDYDITRVQIRSLGNSIFEYTISFE